ncbi:MAG: SHOCT domain-containing protein [Sulfitobacter sp.]|jgi:putative membrane protein|uniref:SHOCT domain-containing protein n=1 Tax=unclassified Sulfitobacter TaxID=196795 RepID=UPI002634700E|nr:MULTISPECIES: SHOCT domain-containing protein [unclassified Sulfitobacter]WPZ28311.1 SHOCT domain-containing protein [Sulfitobacter sp. OXR-159]|tara:strand:+ start:259 stop:576 length:318 start_codon:yes stop_codon:yes gene_type:complete
MKILGFTAIGGSLGLTATPGWAAAGDGFGHMMWDGGFGMWGGLMMVIFWALVIGLILLAVRGFSNRSDTGTGQTAIDILRDRYARGEIDEDEFERRRAKLEARKQ